MTKFIEIMIDDDVKIFWSPNLLGQRDNRCDYVIIPATHLGRLAYKDIDHSKLLHRLQEWANENYNNVLREEELQWEEKRYKSWHERCDSNICDYVCAYCGKDIDQFGHFDHIIPKSRGGKYTFENIVSSCPSCNGKKGARTPEEANMPIRFGRLNLLRTIK
jgi:5-methylcytosine-specific restriction endonuclease McrA